MGDHRPAGSRAFADRSTFRRSANRLLASSLLLYLAAVATQRAWVLLNSDVGQLIKRLH